MHANVFLNACNIYYLLLFCQRCFLGNVATALVPAFAMAVVCFLPHLTRLLHREMDLLFLIYSLIFPQGDCLQAYAFTRAKMGIAESNFAIFYLSPFTFFFTMLWRTQQKHPCFICSFRWKNDTPKVEPA